MRFNRDPLDVLIAAAAPSRDLIRRDAEIRASGLRQGSVVTAAVTHSFRRRPGGIVTFK